MSSRTIVETELEELKDNLKESLSITLGPERYEKLEKYITKRDRAFEKGKKPADRLGSYIEGLFTNLKPSVLEEVCNLSANKIANIGPDLVAKFKLAISQIPDIPTQKELEKLLEAKDFGGKKAEDFLDLLRKNVTKELSSELKTLSIADKVDTLCQYVLASSVSVPVEKGEKEITLGEQIQQRMVELQSLPKEKKPVGAPKKEKKAKKPKKVKAEPKKTEAEVKAEADKRAKAEKIREGRIAEEKVKKEKQKKLEAKEEKVRARQEAVKDITDIQRFTGIDMETDLTTKSAQQLETAEKEFSAFLVSTKKIPLPELRNLNFTIANIKAELKSRTARLTPKDIILGEGPLPVKDRIEKAIIDRNLLRQDHYLDVDTKLLQNVLIELNNFLKAKGPVTKETKNAMTETMKEIKVELKKRGEEIPKLKGRKRQVKVTGELKEQRGEKRISPVITEVAETIEAEELPEVFLEAPEDEFEVPKKRKKKKKQEEIPPAFTPISPAGPKLQSITKTKLKNPTTGAKILLEQITNLKSCPTDPAKFLKLMKEANIQPEAKKAFITTVYDTFLNGNISISDMIHQVLNLEDHLTLEEWNKTWPKYSRKRLRKVLEEMTKKCQG